ncbi:response regulator [bacterium]|nr:response regulator [bacterium]
MTTPLNILIVDDSDADAFLAARALRRAGYDAAWCRVDTPEALAAALRRQQWHLMLCDTVAPRLPISRSLAVVHDTVPSLPVVVLSGRRLDDLGDLLAQDEVRGVLGKDRFDELPALISGLLN